LDGGEVGAARVRWPDGRVGVLKWRLDYTLEELTAGPLAALEALRERGYPAPATQLAVQVGTLANRMRRFSARTAELEAKIAGIGDECATRVPGSDVMHQDFHPGNMLALDGRISGIRLGRRGTRRRPLRPRHTALRAIRHFPSDQVETWVALAGQRLG
jgi:hypothetical protein